MYLHWTTDISICSTSIPTDQHVLRTFTVSELENHITLSDYNIQEKSTLYLIRSEIPVVRSQVTLILTFYGIIKGRKKDLGHKKECVIFVPESWIALDRRITRLMSKIPQIKGHPWDSFHLYEGDSLIDNLESFNEKIKKGSITLEVVFF